MDFYSERNGLRALIAKTYGIMIERYQRLCDVCRRYFNDVNFPSDSLVISSLFSTSESDVNSVKKLAVRRLLDELTYGIPGSLEVLETILEKSEKICNTKKQEKYDSNALLDVIEFIAQNIRPYKLKICLKILGFKLVAMDDAKTFKSFQQEINDVFQRTRLLYRLNDQKQVERVIENSPLTPEVEKTLLSAPERGGLREHLSNAIRLYRSRNKEDVKLAINQLWDALESLKTYYSVSKKGEKTKTLVGELIKKITDYKNFDFEQDSSFNDFLDNEFNLLTHIGNNYNVRHAGPNQKKFPDTRYYDYFFNRCLSLIALAVQYLK